MTSPFANYFDPNISYLKISAAWVPRSKSYSRKDFIQLSYNALTAIFLLAVYFPSECLPLMQYWNDRNMFLRVLRDLGNHATLYVKAYVWYFKRKNILEIVDLLTNYDSSYEEVRNRENDDDFIPSEIVKQYKSSAKTATNLFLYVMLTVVIFMALSVYYVFFFHGDSQYKYDENGDYVYAQPLVINVVSPFGRNTRSQFFVTFLYVALGCTYNGIMIGALDSLFITIISCISAHFKIVEGALKTLRIRCIRHLEKTGAYNQVHLDLKMEKELKRCLTHEKMLRSCINKVQLIYNGQMMYQLVTSLLEICFCLYMLSLKIDSTTATEISYICTTSLQLLIFCWFGQQLADASYSIVDGLYACHWYYASKIFRKNIIFAMERLKRPTLIFLAKIIPLSLGAFISIARASYSVFTLLRKTN